MDGGNDEPSNADTSSTHSRSKKRTPQQLERKRAQDREAQRNNRQRTAALLASQEKRISELQVENEVLREAVTAAQTECASARAEVWESQRKLTGINELVTSAAQIMGTQEVPRISGMTLPQVEYGFPSYSPIYASIPFGASIGRAMSPQSSAASCKSLASPQEEQDLGGPAHAPSITTSGLRSPRSNHCLWPDTWSRDPNLIGLLDQIFLDFVASRKSILQQGGSELLAAGSAEPNMAGIFQQPVADTDIISQLVTQVVSRFTHCSTLPELLAQHWLLFRIIRWKICLTMETYELIPPWAQARPCQLENEYPPWMEIVAWPGMRDELVPNPGLYHYEDFFHVYPVGLSVNWPFDPMECVTRMANGDVAISPGFVRHLLELSNWSMSSTVADTYPALRGTYRINPNTASV